MKYHQPRKTRVEKKYLFILLLFATSFSVCAQYSKDSMIFLANQVGGKPLERIHALIGLKDIQLKKGQDGSIFMEKAWEVADQSGIDSLRYYVKGATMRYFESIGHHHDAYSIGLEMKAIAERMNDYRRVAEINFLIAELFVNMEMMEKAAFYQKKSMEAYVMLRDTNAIKWGHYRLGYYLSQYGWSLEAMRHFETAYKINLRIYPRTKDTWFASETMGWIANCYNAMGEHEKAFECRRKSLEYAYESKDTAMIAEGKHYLGSIFEHMNQHDSAQYYFRKSFELFGKIKKPAKQGMLLYTMAQNFARQKKFHEARLALDQFFDTNEKFRKNKEAFHLTLAIAGDIYRNDKEYKTAAELMSVYQHIKDSLHKMDERNEILEHDLNNNFEKERQERNLMARAREAEEKQEKQKQAFIRNGVIAALGICVIAIFFGLKAYRRSQHTARVLGQQKATIEEKNKEITESMRYAHRIQAALFASETTLKKVFHSISGKSAADSVFVLFKPKDIVTGDFYWAFNKVSTERGKLVQRVIVCSGDSTGHGIPGAFMSLLNITFLNEAVNEKSLFDPAEIFEFVRKKLLISVSNENQMDGMDATLMELCITQNLNEGDVDKHPEVRLRYAAAYNPPFLYSNGMLAILQYDHAPIGFSTRELSYKTHEVTFNSGDCFYLLTDGFTDQFGGENNKKYGRKKLIKFMEAIAGLTMEEQHRRLSDEFDNWKGDVEQTDDVTMIGMRL